MCATPASDSRLEGRLLVGAEEGATAGGGSMGFKVGPNRQGEETKRNSLAFMVA